MSIMLLSTLEAILLSITLSIDAFVASFAYGTNKIKIPFLSVIIINVICSLMLAISLLLGFIIHQLIPQQLTNILCFLILMILGIIKLFDSLIKSYIKKKNIDKNIKFSLFNLNFILRIYADPKQADYDLSRVLSPIEAVSLSIGLSVDGLAVGFGTALANINSIKIIVYSLIFNVLAVVLGCFFGNKIAEKLNINLSWLSGVLLIILAIVKL